MKWNDASNTMPVDRAMVLIKKRIECVDDVNNKYVVSYWDREADCFVCSNGDTFTATHWVYIRDIK